MQSYCRKLSGFGKSRGVDETNHLANQLTLEIIAKTVFGDQSFNLLDVNGDHKLFEALIRICMLKLTIPNLKITKWTDSTTRSIT